MPPNHHHHQMMRRLLRLASAPRLHGVVPSSLPLLCTRRHCHNDDRDLLASSSNPNPAKHLRVVLLKKKTRRKRKCPQNDPAFFEHPASTYEVSVEANQQFFQPEAIPLNLHKFTWEDLDGKGCLETFKREAKALQDLHGLPQVIFDNVSGSDVLPTYQTEGKFTVFVLRLANYERVFDEAHLKQNDHAWSVSDLTNRLTIIVNTEQCEVMTLHAHSLPFMETAVVSEYEARTQTKLTLDNFVWSIVHQVLVENAKAITANKEVFDKMEQFFTSTAHSGRLLTGKGISKGVYGVMRRSSVSSRVLKATVTMLKEVKRDPPVWCPEVSKSANFRRVTEKAHQGLAFTDELHASAKDLLTLHFGTAAHQTNELVKVFNILSATFMPLSFIVGFYGMNFEYLPGTSQIAGIDGVWFMIVAIFSTATSFIMFFKVKGWL